jgi:alpha-ketoglutarate-dependent taurine dioxygenase
VTKIEIEPIKPHIGGVVRVDKRDILRDEVVATIREALEDRTVLVFPRLNASDEEQLALTDKLGKRVNFTRNVPGSNAAAPDVYKITLDEDINAEPEYVLGTYFWHIDGVTKDQALPKATLLSARKTSENGGQTEFASTYAAYAGLPDTEKAELDELRAVHVMEATLRHVYLDLGRERLARWRDISCKMIHPIVWAHRSGRRSLVVGTHADYVVGMAVADGRSLLVRLMEWAAQPSFTYRHEWQIGDLVIWDNWGAMHRVVPYDARSGRTMHRTTIQGEERVAGSMALNWSEAPIRSHLF